MDPPTICDEHGHDPIAGWCPDCRQWDASDSTVTYTRQEILDRLERDAQRRRGMTVGALLRTWRAGGLENPGEVADLLALGHLLADDDPIYRETE